MRVSEHLVFAAIISVSPYLHISLRSLPSRNAEAGQGIGARTSINDDPKIELRWTRAQ
jgi:hypothetical protein